MRQPLTRSPYVTIYARFVDAAVAHAKKHAEKSAEQVLKDVAASQKIFTPYYASFKKSEVDALIKLIKQHRARVR